MQTFLFINQVSLKNLDLYNKQEQARAFNVTEAIKA
jgi:hypothetical protein